MLSRLIGERGGEELGRIELRDSEAVNPTFAATCAATNPKPIPVPLPRLDPITATPAEQRNDHGETV